MSTVIPYIRIKDVLNIDEPQFAFKKILEKVLDTNFKIYVMAEWSPGVPDWVEVPFETIKITYIYDKSSFWTEKSERYGGENLDPEEFAIATGNITNTWIKTEDQTAFKNLFHLSQKQKTLSTDTEVRILQVLVDVLATELEEKCTYSDFLKTEKDSRKISLTAVADHIQKKSSSYFYDVSDGNLPQGFKDRSIRDTLSAARKKIKNLA